jgi:transcriptional regulator with GAF, ATPase, and Fis domain
MLARLTITAGEGYPPVCDLPLRDRVALGRHRANTIVLQDKHASRRHAEIFARDGHWFIKDCDTLNGTKVNGERIQQPTPLLHGHEIGIGDTRLRFSLIPAGDGITPPSLDRTPEAPVPALGRPARAKGRANGKAGEDSGSDFKTLLQADELSALCTFMTASVGETGPRALVARALALVHSHTWATITGFLSLDPEEPLPKLVLPELACVDIHLSRRLTQRVQEEGRPVWLSAEQGPSHQEESLLSYSDALCVPLLADGAALGALHVYKSGGTFAERQVRFCEVLCGYLASSLRLLRSRRTLEAENERLRGHSPAAGNELIGDSPALQQVRAQVARVARRPGTVLIVGESGVGKELVAAALHRGSDRADGPLVTLNCAALPASLVDAELFGHEKGVYTGADRARPGCFRQADEGTLFLDEIGELPLETQAKLLRVIEGKAFRPLGAENEVRVDVRVIAATNRDLEAMVREKRFREDLYFRLGIPIKVPPLREHAEDIPALVEHFLRPLALEYRRPLRLAPAALARLERYPWPGNVRQLRAVLERAVAMTDKETLEAHDLCLQDAGLHPEGAVAGPVCLPTLNLQELEIEAIRQALRRTGGNVTAAADELGIHRDTLWLKMKRYDIKRE